MNRGTQIPHLGEVNRMLHSTQVVSRSVFRTLAVTAFVGLALVATACADSTAPRNDCTIVGSTWVCWP